MLGNFVDINRSLLDFLFSCPWLYFFNARLTPNQLKKETFIIFFIIDFKGKKFLFFYVKKTLITFSDRQTDAKPLKNQNQVLQIAYHQQI